MIFLKYELGLNYFMENVRGIKKLNVKIESDKIKTSNLDSTPNKLLREVERIFNKKSTVNFNIDDILEYRFKANLESSLRAW